MDTNRLPEMQGFEIRKCRVLKHRGTEGTEGGGKKQREGIEGIGRGKRDRKGAPEPDWILGVWGKALVRNSVDFVPLCFKKGF